MSWDIIDNYEELCQRHEKWRRDFFFHLENEYQFVFFCAGVSQEKISPSLLTKIHL